MKNISFFFLEPRSNAIATTPIPTAKAPASALSASSLFLPFFSASAIFSRAISGGAKGGFSFGKFNKNDDLTLPEFF